MFFWTLWILTSFCVYLIIILGSIEKWTFVREMYEMRENHFSSSPSFLLCHPLVCFYIIFYYTLIKFFISSLLKIIFLDRVLYVTNCIFFIFNDSISYYIFIVFRNENVHFLSHIYFLKLYCERIYTFLILEHWKI